MIAWQYWLDFCHTSAGMNHGCTCVPSLLNLLLTSPPHSRPSRLSQNPLMERARLFHVCHVRFLKFPHSFFQAPWWAGGPPPWLLRDSILPSPIISVIFFLFTKFLSSVDPRFMLSVLKSEAAYCKLQEHNEVVDLIPDKSVFLIRGDLLWGPKSSHCQIFHVS